MEWLGNLVLVESVFFIPWIAHAFHHQEIKYFWTSAYTSQLSWIPLGVAALLNFYLFYWLLAGILFLNVIAGIYTYVHGNTISRNTLYLVFETNLNEGQDYLQAFPQVKFLLLSGAAIIFAIVWDVNQQIGAWKQGTLTFPVVAGILAMVSLYLPSLRKIAIQKPQFISDGVSHEWHRSFPNLLWLIFESIKDYRKNSNQQKHLLGLFPEQLEEILSIADIEGPQCHIVIIGESAVRSHMSLYGYERETSPGLQAIQDELYIFNDVISSHSGTIASIRDMLTFCSHDNLINYPQQGTLIQYLKKAGFKTAWISNQNPAGYNENFASMLGRSCDQSFFVNAAEHYSQTSYDEKVFPPLSKVLSSWQDEHKFIFIHLMGQHFYFDNRYPQSFNYYTDIKKLEGQQEVLEQINHYDNATRYNDHIVTSVIESIRQYDQYASVLYLSDHGIDLFEYSDTASQSEWDGSPPMFEIPFVLWLSSEFKRQQPSLIDSIIKAKDRKIIASDLIHSLPELAGFKIGNRQNHRNIFSQYWQFHKRVIADDERQVSWRDYDKDIKPIKTTNKFRADLMKRQNSDFRNKVWAHGCNSVGKLEEVVEIFKGAEVDLVYDGQATDFDVTHPPTSSIGLMLSDYLAQVNISEDFYFWFDMKNINPDNCASASQDLLTICDVQNLRVENCIVESPHVEILSAFSDKGFLTSFYLPSHFIRQLEQKNYQGLSKQELEDLNNLRQRFMENLTWSISIDARHLEFVSLHFPEAERYLSWFEFKSPYDHFRRLEIQEVLNQYPQLEVLLVKHPSVHTRY